MKRLMMRVLIVYAIFQCCLGNILAQSQVDSINARLPEFLGTSAFGTEFWLTVPPPMYEEYSVNDNKIKLIIISNAEATVAIEYENKKINQFIQPFNSTIVLVNPGDVLPYNKSGMAAEAAEFVAPGKAIHIRSDNPVMVYVMIDYISSTEGYLAYPVSALGTKYIVSSYSDCSSLYPMYNSLPSLTGIVAAYDNTKIKFTLGGSASAKTAGGLSAGQSKEENLSKGDVWIISSGSDGSDLSGSIIESNNPVAVISGNQCANIPFGNPICNYLVEQDIPVDTWGKTFHLWTTANRKYGSVMRIYAKEPDTKVYRDGSLLTTLKTGGGLINEGYIETRVLANNVPGNTIITSDKPVSVSIYNSGQGEDGDPQPNSDPFQINVFPLEQFHREMTFYSMGMNNVSGWSENYLIVIYPLDTEGKVPESLEYAQVFDGPLSWKKVRYAQSAAINGDYSFKPNGIAYGVKIIPFPTEGVFRLRSDVPVMAYCYGSYGMNSFGFPASAVLKNLTKNDTQPPVPVWTVKCDGNVEGSVTDMPPDPDLRSNLSIIFFYEDESINYIFENDPFIPQVSNQTYWRLKIIDPAKDARGVIRFTDDAGNDTHVIVEYFAPKLLIEPTFVNFGQVGIHQSKIADIKVLNLSNGPYRIDELTFKTNQAFRVLLPQVPIILAPKEEVMLKVEFTAIEEGIFTDSLGIDDNCFFAYKIGLEGQSWGPEISVSDINFGDRTSGKTYQESFTISNIGKSRLEVTGYRGPVSPDFKMSLPDGVYITQSQPLLLNPGDEPVRIIVEYSPQALGNVLDSIIFTSNAKRIDSVAYLTARSISPGLVANSVDFGRRRIHRPNYPAGPYLPGNNGIRLENSGSQEITITGLMLKNSVNGDAFIYDTNDIINSKIPAFGFKEIPVLFKPLVTGEHSLVIEYENTAGNSTQTILHGVGIAPKLRTDNVEFDSTVVGDEQSISVRKVRFTNLPRQDWEYCDTARITGFSSLPVEAISYFLTEFGKEGFKFDRHAMPDTIILQPGDFIDFDVYFQADKAGRSFAELYSESDAISDISSEFTGYGILYGQRITADSAVACPGERKSFHCRLENFGSLDVDVLSLKIEPQENSISFANPDDADGFLLKAGETVTVELIFTPTETFDRNYTISAVTNSPKGVVISGDFNAKSYIVDQFTSLNPAFQTVRVGDRVNYLITLDSDVDISEFAINNFSVLVHYDPHYFAVQSETVVEGDLLKGSFVIDGKPFFDYQNGNIMINFKSSGIALNGSGELLNFTLRSYLPPDTLDQTEISHQVSTNDSKCVVFTPRNAQVSIVRPCLSDKNQITISPYRYYLNRIVPNPADGSNISFSYGVALDGMTKIEIYNSSGELMHTAINSRVKAGEYVIQLPPDALSSGVYLCRMASGPFADSFTFVVVK